MISLQLKETGAKHEMIAKYQSLAEMIACKVGRQYYRWIGVEELKQQARYALVYAVEAIANGAIDEHTDLDNNVEKYINLCVFGKVKGYIHKFSLIRAAPKTYFKLREKGHTIKQVVGEPADREVEISHTAHDLQEVLNKILKDDTERKIVELVAQNFNGAEIAKQLNMTRAGVNYRLQGIRKRANEYVVRHGPVC